MIDFQNHLGGFSPKRFNRKFRAIFPGVRIKLLFASYFYAALEDSSVGLKLGFSKNKITRGLHFAFISFLINVKTFFSKQIQFKKRLAVHSGPDAEGSRQVFIFDQLLSTPFLVKKGPPGNGNGRVFAKPNDRALTKIFYVLEFQSS